MFVVAVSKTRANHKADTEMILSCDSTFLKANGFTSVHFNMGTEFGNSKYGEAELKGTYFLAEGEYIKPDFTHLKRLEAGIKTWWLSHQKTEPNQEYLNMLITTACTFAGFVIPTMDIESDAMLVLHYFCVNLWSMDDVLDQQISVIRKVRFY